MPFFPQHSSGRLWALSPRYTVVFVAFVAGCKKFFVRIGKAIITEKNLRAPRNLRKFCDQSWQLVIHIFMTAAGSVLTSVHPVLQCTNSVCSVLTEIYLLGRDSVKWSWYYEPSSLEPGGMWDNRVDQAEDDPELRSFYLAQVCRGTSTSPLTVTKTDCDLDLPACGVGRHSRQSPIFRLSTQRLLCDVLASCCHGDAYWWFLFAGIAANWTVGSVSARRK